MKLAIAIPLLTLVFTATAHAYCKVKLPDGSWYYGDKCAQISHKGMPEEAIDQSAPAVVRDLHESRDVDEGLERQRLRGHDYSHIDDRGVRVRPAGSADDYRRQ